MLGATAVFARSRMPDSVQIEPAGERLKMMPESTRSVRMRRQTTLKKSLERSFSVKVLCFFFSRRRLRIPGPQRQSALRFVPAFG
jgi:hypothetical protein